MGDLGILGDVGSSAAIGVHNDYGERPMVEGPYEYFDRVRARRFELVDDGGNVRAVLSVEHESGLVGLHVGDREAHPTISIGVDEATNDPYVIMREPGEEGARVFLTISPEGHAILHLRDRDGSEYYIHPHSREGE